MPKFTIECFDRKYENWQQFCEKFKIAIHENVELSNADKINFITNVFKRTALKCIHGLVLTQNNYDAAIGLLE